MYLIRNILAIFGLISILSAAYLGAQFSKDYKALDELDPKAKALYQSMWNKLKETGNSADATVWKRKVEEGVTAEDVAEAMSSVATEVNIKEVSTLKLSKEVEGKTGKSQRLLTIFQYCYPQTAMRMIEHSDAFSAFLPCRISMVEDKSGQLWLYAADMDFMIYGGKTLPDELREEAIKVKEVMLRLMEAGATGEF